MSAPNAEKPAAPPSPAGVLEQGTYEVIRSRLAVHGADLQARLQRLNEARRAVFGAIKTNLVATERVTTLNKCTPRDMVAVGAQRFLFGYNVLIGLRSETQLSDVFALYEHRDHQFRELPLDMLAVPEFVADFKSLYRFYRQTTFTKFSIIGPHLFMVFQVGKNPNDIKTFKWLLGEDRLVYLGNRSDHEFGFPPQHEFEWIRTHRELHRFGLHPHISIEDRLFVETVGGDLTVKVEDNTATGEGIYAEPVENKDQTLDDAEIYYAIVGNLILLKIRPYQEKTFRHLVFNEKLQQIRRIDTIEDACVLLPDGHGIIFSNGYYLQTGEFKTFESPLSGLKFDGRRLAPNGEDHLFKFYHPESGNYILMSYNVIEQRVELPLVCGGCSFFDNGELALFKDAPEPQKHHVIQIWQTPYTAASAPSRAVDQNSLLFKIGNPDLVRALGECHEVLNLLNKPDTYANLYFDLAKKTGDIQDSFFWLAEEQAANLKAALSEIRKAAASALEEFDKVVRLRRRTAEQVKCVTGKAHELVENIPYQRLNEIGLFVQNLGQLLAVRGELISLKELRYVELPAVEAAEKEVAEHVTKLSGLAVQFLLTDRALEPYRKRAENLLAQVPAIGKVTEAKRLEEELATTGKELEMLMDVVSNLKIEDATQTARIIEGISAIYTVLNQARAALKQKNRQLQSVEASAEFASQSRLLNQTLISYLDRCATPAQCEESLTRLLVQIEELEGRFADFEEFVLELTRKRSEVCSAFESRKLELVEARNRRTQLLLTSADRILKGVKHRVEQLKTVEEINGYYASDRMVEKVRDIVGQLLELEDSVKADELQGRLKTIREDAVRQLKDRLELFVEGQNVVQFGKHRFSVNTQELDLTVVHREGELWFHLTGTRFVEKIEDPDLQATRALWEQEFVSENVEVYRAEYLAWLVFQQLERDGKIAAAAQWSEAERLQCVRDFLQPRYAEAYVKGVHDLDAARLLGALLELHTTIDLLRYPAQARACATAFWRQLAEGPQKELLTAKLRSHSARQQLFPDASATPTGLREVRQLLTAFSHDTGLFEEQWCEAAAEYLYHEVRRGREFVISSEAAGLFARFQTHLSAHRFEQAFAAARAAVKNDFAGTVELLRDWMRGFILSLNDPEKLDYLDEAIVLLLRGECPHTAVLDVPIVRPLKGMAGTHPVIQDGTYQLHYVRFVRKLRHFERQTVPQFERYQALKRQLLQRRREELCLEQFKARVLTSFVRNRLIDEVYLPLIGNNLAKQIGVAGEGKRTDLMGLLLIISPPGYGKTTLMEYVASRLGMVFMKINGPALGDKVVALDPAQAPNAAARQELEKLNLGLEMGDNVMLYLDDIQHCHPELLQKFISLCDGQRRIEGVYRTKPRTYDLRGRKVAVVMAGNPYTENGDKFQVPDMLANRADTYNLGDILGGHEEAFKLSYLENAMTSNPVLNQVALRSPKDFYPLVQLAQNGSRDGLEFAADYSVEELNQVTNVMQKLLRVRDVILRVNSEYIRSAAQADAYRTEPAFKLQGSYRNMNRLAERLLPIMNEQEVAQLLEQHYRNEAQTLAKGAEANLLKFKELVDALSAPESQRWTDIKRTFKKNLLLRTDDGRDPVSLVVGQLSAFSEGLDSIKEVLAARPAAAPGPATLILLPTPKAQPDGAIPLPSVPSSPSPLAEEGVREIAITPETLKRIWELVEQQPPPPKPGQKAAPDEQ
jgi:hypothetical protein